MDFQRKAGVPGIGIAVCILEDQHGLILHHKVMEKETDDKVAVVMVDAAERNSLISKDAVLIRVFTPLLIKRNLKPGWILWCPKKGKPIKLEGRRDLRDIRDTKEDILLWNLQLTP
jgi:hypothetical protein